MIEGFLTLTLLFDNRSLWQCRPLLSGNAGCAQCKRFIAVFEDLEWTTPAETVFAESLIRC
jgi:hypothetical protein